MVKRHEHRLRRAKDPKTKDQMIASTERGILVHTPVVHPRSRSLSKDSHRMTRDGTFYVENGKIQYGVRNFRFNERLDLTCSPNVQDWARPFGERRRVFRYGGSTNEG